VDCPEKSADHRTFNMEQADNMEQAEQFRVVPEPVPELDVHDPDDSDLFAKVA
jgi:hypothetical protein